MYLQTLFNLGVGYKMLNNSTKSIKYFDESLSFISNSPGKFDLIKFKVLNNLSQYRIEQNDFKGSLKLFK